MAEGTKEFHFEDHIARYLTRDITPFFKEYELKPTSVYDKELCLIPEDVIGFIQDTQPKKYEALKVQYGDLVDAKIIYRVADSLTKRKTLSVFREKIKDRGQTLDLVYFKPNHDKSPEHQEWYNKNRLTIIRQLKYSKNNENSIDLVFFVNGIPVITMELKNALTGQNHLHSIKQYIEDRDPNEKLFEFKRCLVHFAVGTEKVFMTTRLAGKSTFFLPFNKALINENPDGYPTSYLWEDVLTKDSLLDLIQNYINLQDNKEKFYDPKTRTLREKSKEILIFPRFHQRRAVQKLLKDVTEKGVGQKYLIQHSAGSGKSNTISWLAHRLSDFYQRSDDAKALFSGVIVVTDRKVLDRQIQDNIRQFEQTPGTVAYIDDSKTSQDLKAAIEDGKRVIVTTLQKFPVISEFISQNKSKTYAVIIDEAHSSQSGESARHLRKALSLEESEEKDVLEKNIDEIIEEEIKRKGDQSNISFFAFTATPKPKTLEIFGTEKNGQRVPFDVYTMEQAIKEGFILDVLKNYVSWRRYYKLVRREHIPDKEYETRKTVRLLSSYVDLQDHAIERKTRIMLEHFVSKTQNEIQGKARAMLVTRSRLHAVRYKRKFDEIMRELKLPYEALVAFSGTVTDAETGMDYTKENMNNLGGKVQIPDALKLPQYRILIVANMYQTGFDEPLLHTMFVDKKLGGTSTVQTISRLNRKTSGKDSTMVLDFVNDPEKIRQDFQDYYGGTYMELIDQTDPNSLYDVLGKIESAAIFTQKELDDYAELFFRKGDHKEKLQPILERVANLMVKHKPEEEIAEIKSYIKDFIRLYRFLSQIISFTDVNLEKNYVFLTDLYKKLPVSQNSLPTEVLEEIDLGSFKLQHQFTTSLKLESADKGMTGMKPMGPVGPSDEDKDFLSNIIKTLNETFGIDLKEEDQVEFEKMKKNIYANEELMSFFNDKNSKENIKDKFNEEIDNELLNFINDKLDFYNKLTENKINSMFKKMWFDDIYDKRVRGI
ncbi:Type I restriction-modification system, restriction subunit R [Lunatimonas lonarensis]|uniref:Type I restriction-modification system, restriction subunit R n=1 Tax=Lunatimonas lonarensis TaxID=1232681 RepID=R7ZUE2_9BACT|nr:DEAD/DEAH box helicase family protein [Lunatimonas lonarensis]EON77692.1 Type I restriction-modification system, restriction subunit R [Lunatimonas lonarensis]